MTREELNKLVLAEYDRIFALPEDQINDALFSYWETLERTCSPENLCLECQRHLLLEEESLRI